MMELFYYAALGLLSFIVTFIFTKLLIPRLARAGITGIDENKSGQPAIPEMGGIAIVAGFSAGMLLAIFFNSFAGFEFNLVNVLAAIITIHAIAFIGMVDDLISIPQWLKAVLPLFAAVPLVVVKAAGSTALSIPFIGMVDLGIFYIFILVPIAIAVCSNLTNMLAGFNGLESGMAAVMFAALTVLAVSQGQIEMSIITLSMLAALVAFMYFNKYPAKVFPGDVGNLTIGVAVASAVIIGNLETAGVILMMPYIADFAVKVKNRFPHTHQDLKGGKLYPKDGRVKGLVHVVMKAFKGISERNLVLFFIAVELVFAAIALILYFRV
jgi:UDP-N-acetylglucosamine--dolichyl-phosphate N-acetylglucosaminephosphotransferase